MKKVLSVVFVIFVMLTTACVNSGNNDNREAQTTTRPYPTVHIEHTEKPEQTGEPEETEEPEQTDEPEGSEDEELTQAQKNPFFLTDNDYDIRYAATYEIPLVEGFGHKEVIVRYSKEAGFTGGALYKFTITEAGELEYLGEERLTIFLFVTENNIYRIWDMHNPYIDFDSIDETDKAYIVCSNEEIPDALGEYERGVHMYIEIIGDEVISHLYHSNEHRDTKSERKSRPKKCHV